MKKKILFIGAAVIVIAGLVLGMTAFKKNKNGTIKFKMDTVSRGDIEALVVTSGTLNPVRLVEVGSQVSGNISKIFVDFNSQVKEGQVLAEIDPSILQAKINQDKANYLSAQASLERAKVTMGSLKKAYERAKALFDKKLISFEEMDSAEASYLNAQTDVRSSQARVEQAKSQLDSSTLDLSFATIRSPIDGVVINRLINVGQTVAANFSAPKLFEIANDLSRMQVECDVDEADIGKVKEGQNVRFTVDSFPDDVFTGTVQQVRYSATVSQNVVTYKTIVEVSNPELKLRPGMTATVSIITGDAKNVLRVPNAALRFNPEISPEEMIKAMKEAGERLFARFQKQGGSPNGPAPGSAAPSNPGSGGSPQMRKFNPSGGLPKGGKIKPPSKVWIKDKNGKLRIEFIRPGVSDNSFTEILRGELAEGQEVIVGTETAKAAQARNNASTRPPQRMMFIGR
jgi:HlyD family secretion protein